MIALKTIMFLITTTIAKHHHSNLDPNDYFFGSIYVAIHTVINNLFESIDLGKNFTNQSNTKLLLTMHHDLKNIADVAIKTYNVIQNIINDNNTTPVYVMYSHNETKEDLITLDAMVNEILNKNNFDVYRAIKGTKHNRAKDKIKDNVITEEDTDKSEKVNLNPAFKDSEEFTDFVMNFLAKGYYLTLRDFKKSEKYVRLAVSSKKNLKTWEAPSSLIFDLEEIDTRRIFGGTKTRVNHFPFIVSIHIMGEFTCSGCIISRDLVITAGSCLNIAYKNDFFERNLKSIYVRLGSDHTTRGGETIPVQNLYFHPEYEPKNLRNNLAIIVLEKRVRFSRKQKKIRRILWDKTTDTLPNDTRVILILGWGATKTDEVTQRHPQLRVGMLEIYNNTDCRKKYTEDFITKENFCAAVNGINGSACNGDVGSPGIVGGMLIGVVSFGAPECGAVGAPTVFTKLGYYVPWIESVINAHKKNNQSDDFDARRKSEYLNKKKIIQVNKESTDVNHGREKYYSEEEIALRDTLIELVKDNQTVVHDIIYGDLYEEFSKFFKPNEEIDLEENFIDIRQKTAQKDITSAPLFEFKLNFQTDRNHRNTAHTKKAKESTSFKILGRTKAPADFDYETDTDAVHDYSDNYEKSSDEEHGLSIQVPPRAKLSLRNTEDRDEPTWSSNSDSDSNKHLPDESTDYSEEIREFFTTKRVNAKYKNSYKRYKGKERSKVMKHDQFSKHASSVLDEGKSLATKTFLIDFDTTDVQVNYDKHKRKSKTGDRKGKHILRPNETLSKTFLFQF